MLKDSLERMHAALTELEAAARGLQNKNFADIVKSAAGKVHQLTEHPDLDKVHDVMSEPASAESAGARPFPGPQSVRDDGSPFTQG